MQVQITIIQAALAPTSLDNVVVADLPDIDARM